MSSYVIKAIKYKFVQNKVLYLKNNKLKLGICETQPKKDFSLSSSLEFALNVM